MNVDHGWFWDNAKSLAIFYLWKKMPFCGQHKCYQFLWMDENFSKIVPGSEKGVMGDCNVSNFTSLHFELRILDFFQNSHFFHKKWLINIYHTCQKYTSLRKYDSRSNSLKFEQAETKPFRSYIKVSKMLQNHDFNFFFQIASKMF